MSSIREVENHLQLTNGIACDFEISYFEITRNLIKLSPDMISDTCLTCAYIEGETNDID